ncbi:MAG: hypothetical protein QM612_02090 [Thermomonas sp.]|uniref:hypothetical protein n=1 Tax=Thermomonas sp. TaxID=1971895 RepID=UPI0039E4BBF9
MFMNARSMVLSGLLTFSAVVSATTWLPTRITDPISGKQCVVQTPGSSGSYIYQWPEKYDQVFWPLTDRYGIWVCRSSGFAAFIGDIELDDEEKTAIRRFLKNAVPLPKEAGMGAVLARVESIYALRKVEPDAKSRILRALAYQYESNGLQAKANELRSQAAAIMETRLADEKLEPMLRLQYLFVTANYARELGQVESSDQKLKQLSPLLADASTDEKLKGYAEYVQELIVSARKIAPGGRLAPGE